MKRQSQFLLLATVALSAGCTVTTPQGGGSTSSVSTMHVQPTTAQVVKRDIVGYDIFPAEVTIPDDAQAAIMPTYRAPVQKIDVNVGQWVKKGAPVLHLSIPDVQASVQSSSITVQQAKAAYDAARAQYDAPVKASKAQLDSARAAEQAARAQAAQTGDNTELAQATSNRQAAEAALLQAQAELKQNLAPAAQQVAAAEAAYRQTKAGSGISVIRAPITGMVTELTVSPGAEVGEDASKPIGKIVDLNRMRVAASLSADQAARLQKHMPVVLRFKEIPDQQFTGRIESIATVPVRTANGQSETQWQATVSFDDDKHLVKPGMLVTMCGVRTGEVFNVLSVPVQAVARDSAGNAYVDVQQGSNWVQTAVKTGMTDGQYIQITDGLAEGQVVQVPPQTSK